MTRIGVEPLKHIVGFPYQLYEMLNDAEPHGFQDIVSWLQCGKIFKVHKPDEFARKIMSRYFNQTQYKSFLRQLNMYKFHRFQTGERKGSYFHMFFQRGRLELCPKICRVKVNRDKASRRSRKGGIVSSFGSVFPGTMERANLESIATSSDRSISGTTEELMMSLLPIEMEEVKYPEVAPTISSRDNIPSDIVDEIITTFGEGPNESTECILHPT
jgi:heat shock transcription factor 1